MLLSRNGPTYACSTRRQAKLGYISIKLHRFQSARPQTHGRSIHRSSSTTERVRSRGSAPAASSSRTEAGVSALDVSDSTHQLNKESSINYFEQWYPVGFTKDFDPAIPHRFTLLGIPLVIWYQPPIAPSAATSSSSSSSTEARGVWRAFSDVCPHRLVPLSEGRITADGLLECPYHGWTFNGAGGCEQIPQVGNYATPRACATAFPAVVKQDMLFVKPKPLPKQPVKHGQVVQQSAAAATAGSNGNLSHHISSGSGSSTDLCADVPITPELEEGGWLVTDTWRDVPYDWSSLMENVLDASHVPFTHHKSISNRNSIGAYDVRMSEPVSRTGFRSIWSTGPRAGHLGPQTSWYRPPCFMMQKIDAKATKGYESLVIVYAVPIVPGRCRLLNRNAFSFTKGGGIAGWFMKVIPGWATHLATQVPLEDDQIFLHLGEESYLAAAAGKTAAQAYYMPSQADTNVIAFRKWVDEFGGGGPFGPVRTAIYRKRMQPRLDRAQLLDRYSQHTVHCAQCQAGLKQVKTARAVLLTAARVAGILGLLSAAAGLSTIAVTAAMAVPQTLGERESWLLRTLAAATGHLLQLLIPLGHWSDSAATTAAAAAVAGGGVCAVAGRTLLLLGAAGVCWVLYSKLGALEQAFYTGTYPPPRNTDRS